MTWMGLFLKKANPKAYISLEEISNLIRNNFFEKVVTLVITTISLLTCVVTTLDICLIYNIIWENIIKALTMSYIVDTIQVSIALFIIHILSFSRCYLYWVSFEKQLAGGSEKIFITVGLVFILVNRQMVFIIFMKINCKHQIFEAAAFMKLFCPFI
jgi:hypothetical protein